MIDNTFAIYALDHPESLPKRAPLRDAHLARLRALQQDARLTLAGPLSDHQGNVQGSLIIAQFPSLQEAETWFRQDPYVLAGIYQSIMIKPFKPVLPDK